MFFGGLFWAVCDDPGIGSGLRFSEVVPAWCWLSAEISSRELGGSEVIPKKWDFDDTLRETRPERILHAGIRRHTVR